MSKKNYYMNPGTGSVDTWENWLDESSDWEGDAQAQLDSLLPVVWDASAQDWLEWEPEFCKSFYSV